MADPTDNDSKEKTRDEEAENNISKQNIDRSMIQDEYFPHKRPKSISQERVLTNE